MSDLTDPRPPLPEWILEAYDVLASHMTDVEDDCNTQGSLETTESTSSSQSG